MINQIGTNSANNVFAPLQNNGVQYAIIKPFTPQQKKEFQKEKDKKANTWGLKIAGIALVAGLGALALLRGLPKNTRFKLNNFFKYVDEKTIKLAENKRLNKLTQIQNFYYKALKGVKSLLKKSRSIFTLASLKDVGVNKLPEILSKKFAKKAPKVSKFLDKVTAVFDKTTYLFEKISVRTLKFVYSRTLIHFDGMFAKFAEANAKIPKSEAIILEKRLEKVRLNFTNSFSETARNERLTQVKNDLHDIGNQVWDRTYGSFKRFLTDKDTYQTFLAEEIAAPAKLKLNNKVDRLREAITISADDNYNATRKLLNEIDTFVDPTDIESRTLIKNIRKNLSDYRSAVKTGKNANEILRNSDIVKNLDALDSYISELGKSGKYDTKATKEVSAYIKNLNKILVENRKGEIQEIMDEYRRLLSPEDYKKLEKSVNKSLKSLNFSIDLETDKLFDKIRDLLIGSAPKDTLGVLVSLGAVGWFLSKAENKDERTSAALKFGIPAIGGVAIALLCTVGLIPAGPSLMIGLLSTLPINKLGEYIDNTRKKYKNNQPIIDIPNIDLAAAQKALSMNDLA